MKYCNIVGNTLHRDTAYRRKLKKYILVKNSVPWGVVVPKIIHKYVLGVRWTNIRWKLVANFNAFVIYDISDCFMLHFDAMNLILCQVG